MPCRKISTAMMILKGASETPTTTHFRSASRVRPSACAYSIAYTYSKSIDQSSSMADTLDPFNFELTRALSAWNLTHNFVATYDYRLPLELLARRRWARDVLQGWELSGITRVSTGFPITLSTTGDKSLQGSSPNGVNNPFCILPDYNGAPGTSIRCAMGCLFQSVAFITMPWAQSETLRAVFFRPGNVEHRFGPVRISESTNPRWCRSAWKLSTSS